jgi:uncharacterized protein YdgA (DUF945 family)
VSIESLSGESASFSNIDFEGNGQKINSVWMGEHTLKTGEMYLNRASDFAEFKWGQSRYEFSSSLNDENNRVNTRHLIELHKVETDEGKIEHTLFDFELGGIDSVAFGQLINFYRDGAKLETESALEKVRPYVEQLFSRGFFLSLNALSINISDENKADTSFKLSIPEGTDNVSNNPTVLIPKLIGTASTHLTHGFAQQFPLINKGINKAKQNGFVSEVDDTYIIDAEINNGSVDFSTGRKLPLMGLLVPIITQ